MSYSTFSLLLWCYEPSYKRCLLQWCWCPLSSVLLNVVLGLFGHMFTAVILRRGGRNTQRVDIGSDGDCVLSPLKGRLLHALAGLVLTFPFLLTFQIRADWTVKVRTLPVFERGSIWTASERWNMMHVTDVSRQMEKSPHSPYQHLPQSGCRWPSCHSGV